MGLIVACVLYYLIALWMRPIKNPEALKQGKLFRKLSAARDVNRDKPYKLSTNLTRKAVTGVGTMLHFRWSTIMMVWAIFGTVVFGLAGVLFWERLGILHVPNSRKSYEACEENVAYQEREFSRMEVFYLACTALLYVVTFIGSLFVAYYQRLKFQEEDRDNTTMKDFAIFCEGFKEMNGSLLVENVIRNQLRNAHQFKDLDIVTVSVCWNYLHEIDEIEALIDRELDALDERIHKAEQSIMGEMKRPGVTAASLSQEVDKQILSGVLEESDGIVVSANKRIEELKAGDVSSANEKAADEDAAKQEEGGSEDAPDADRRSCANPYCYSVDAVLGIGDFECAGTAEEAEVEEPPEEVTLFFAPKGLELKADQYTGRVESVGGQSELAGVQTGWRVIGVNGEDFEAKLLKKYDEGTEDYYIKFLTSKELSRTFNPSIKLGLKSYDDTGIIDKVEPGSQAEKEGIRIGWKMIQLSGQLNGKNRSGEPYSKQLLEELENSDSPYDITFSKETTHLLMNLKSSPCCFVVFKSEEQRDKALEELKKEPLKIEKKEIMTRQAFCEPSTVIWKGFGSTKFKFYFAAISGCFIVFFSVILLDILFYAPYVVYIFSYSDVPGMSQGSFLSNFTLSLLISACNAMIYNIIGAITDRCSWTNGDSKDCFYCVKYTLAVFFNTCLDLGTVLILAQGFSIDEAIKQQIAEDATMSTKAVAESPNMQRAIYEQLVAYIFPSCTLVPFLIEPFATTFGPFLVGTWLVRSRKEVTIPAAERCLQCPPFDLSRYGDIIVNMMLCCLTLVFTYPGLWMLFAYMIISLVVIYAWDHLRVLRYTTRTFFANNTMDNAVMYMMAMPCAVLVAAMIFKAYGASHQGFLEELKRQFRGEYGVSPDRYNIFIHITVAFVGHLIVHWACLRYFVIPSAEKHLSDKDPRDPLRAELKNILKEIEGNDPAKADSAETKERHSIEKKVFKMMGGTDEGGTAQTNISREEFADFLEKKVKWQELYPDCRTPEEIFEKFKHVDKHNGLSFLELYPPDYQQTAKEAAANWLTTNPVFCLRSKYIYKHEVPCTFFRMGKEHLIKKNEAIEQYFHGKVHVEPPEEPTDDDEDDVDEEEREKSEGKLKGYTHKASRKIKKSLAYLDDGV
jgi:hypothetical protein